MQTNTEQINIKAPKHLKDFAKQCASSNYQSLSSYLVKLIAEEKARIEKKREVSHELVS